MRDRRMWMMLAVVFIGLVGSEALAAPPRWAPAHGRRRRARVVRRVYVPAPFIYSGVVYVPLRDVTSAIGVALVWDSPDGRASFVHNGRDFVLMVGSPTVFFGGRTVVMPAAPIIVENVVYVPSVFIERYVGLPVRHVSGRFSFEGPRGAWHDFVVAPKPPRRVVFGPPVSGPFRAPAPREKTHPSIRRLPGPHWSPVPSRPTEPPRATRGREERGPAARPGPARPPQPEGRRERRGRGNDRDKDDKHEGGHGRGR